mmetsp:Transcript_1641/g.7181  ORF Transcript_1641/g.7181 Transcript_1641/m.7181 type:complete len:203 (-) Transcript_1641:222-830(-)
MKGAIITGGQHIIMPKRMVLTVLLVAAGIFVGIFLSERLRFGHITTKMTERNNNVKTRNEELRLQKEGYKALFDELSNQLKTWKGNHDLSLLSQKAEAETFQRSADTLLTGLTDMKELLQEKEIELLEKEHLLAIQQEQLLDTEDMTDEMAEFINEMAQKAREAGIALPEGLEAEFFFGRDDAAEDDDMLLEEIPMQQSPAK